MPNFERMVPVNFDRSVPILAQGGFFVAGRSAAKMIPMPMGAMPQMGVLVIPAEAQPKMRVLKYSIMVLWMCTLGLIIIDFRNTFGVLGTFCSCMAGTFLFREDPHCKGCHACLNETCVSCCAGPGGAFCILPFMVFTGVNLIMSLIDMLLSGVPLSTSGGWVAPTILFFYGTLLSQIVGLVLSCQVHRMMQSSPPSDGLMLCWF